MTRTTDSGCAMSQGGARRWEQRGASAVESLILVAMAALMLLGAARYATRVGEKVDCQTAAVATLGSGTGSCAPGGVVPDMGAVGAAVGAVKAEAGAAVAVGGTGKTPAELVAAAPPGEVVLVRAARAADPAPAPAPPPPPEPRDPVADKLAQIDRLEGEIAGLREQRKTAKVSSTEDRIDDAIGAKERQIAEIQKELFGGRVDWRRAQGAASDPDLHGQLLPLDPGARRQKMARLPPADVRGVFAKADELEGSVRKEKGELHAVVTRVRSPEIEQLRAEAADLNAQAKAHFATADGLKWAWQSDRSDAENAAGARKATKARELEAKILALQIDGSAPATRDRYRHLEKLEAQVRQLRGEAASAHLPPTMSSNDEALRAMSPEDQARAWAAWARQQREYDRIAAFERALTARPDRAEVQAEIDAAIAAARKEVHAKLPDKARGEFDRLFVPKAVIGDDGKISVGFVPTEELRALQMRQAAFVGYERIEFRSRRTRPFDAPTTSSEALAWWLTFGSTPPHKLGVIVEANHSIRATGDEMILVPGGTLMRGVGTASARQLVRGGLTEIVVNAALVVGAEKVAEKFGPAAGTATPFAVILTALVTRRVVSGPRAAAAGPALSTETKAALNAEVKVAANAGKAAEVAKGFKTKPMEPHYVGEHLPNNPIWGTQVKYLDDVERQAHKLTVRDGKLYTADGKLFDTAAASTAHSGGGRAIFVMDSQGRIYASTSQEVGKFHHSSLLGGKPVTGAGELVVEKGVVKLVSNKSGHYRPTAEMNDQVLKSLEAHGVDISKIQKDLWR